MGKKFSVPTQNQTGSLYNPYNNRRKTRLHIVWTRVLQLYMGEWNAKIQAVDLNGPSPGL